MSEPKLNKECPMCLRKHTGPSRFCVYCGLHLSLTVAKAKQAWIQQQGKIGEQAAYNKYQQALMNRERQMMALDEAALQIKVTNALGAESTYKERSTYATQEACPDSKSPSKEDLSKGPTSSAAAATQPQGITAPKLKRESTSSIPSKQEKLPAIKEESDCDCSVCEDIPSQITGMKRRQRSGSDSCSESSTNLYTDETCTGSGESEVEWESQHWPDTLWDSDSPEGPLWLGDLPQTSAMESIHSSTQTEWPPGEREACRQAIEVKQPWTDKTSQINWRWCDVEQDWVGLHPKTGQYMTVMKEEDLLSRYGLSSSTCHGLTKAT